MKEHWHIDSIFSSSEIEMIRWNSFGKIKNLNGTDEVFIINKQFRFDLGKNNLKLNQHTCCTLIESAHNAKINAIHEGN